MSLTLTELSPPYHTPHSVTNSERTSANRKRTNLFILFIFRQKQGITVSHTLPRIYLERVIEKKKKKQSKFESGLKKLNDRYLCEDQLVQSPRMNEFQQPHNSHKQHESRTSVNEYPKKNAEKSV